MEIVDNPVPEVPQPTRMMCRSKVEAMAISHSLLRARRLKNIAANFVRPCATIPIPSTGMRT